ncbi:MAG: LysM peptidoglycan-binding domain-containing protein [Firmicutes bacterium]|nr:LysM peptidoglycan-binding domain-containing protein [Bacillota bacterium]
MRRRKRRREVIRKRFVSIVGLLVLLSFASGYVFTQRSAASDYNILQEYVVQPGDTLWSIAQIYVSPKTDIRLFIRHMQALNELPSPIIQPGQVLLIPTP